MSNNSLDVSPALFHSLIAHQDNCTAKLQEQISVMISNQEKLHQQFLAGPPAQTLWRCYAPERSADDQEKLHQQFLAGSPAQTPLRCYATERSADNQASDKPIERGSERISGASAQTKLFMSTRRVSQVTMSYGADNDFRPSSSVLTHGAELEEDRLFESEEAKDNWVERRPTRLGKKLQKVATRLSRAPYPLILPQMANVNSDLVRSATQQAHALAASSNERLAESKANRLQRILRSTYFDSGCAVMLLTNAIFIGVQVEYAAQQQDLEAPLSFKLVDYTYGIWFIIELLMRLVGAGLSFFSDPEERTWNIFDFVIVVSNSAEMGLAVFVQKSGPLATLSMVRMVRVARVVRIARVIRVMRFFRSLRILLNAIFSTLKSCIWAAMLFFIILYMFGIIFVQGTTEYRIEVDPSLHAEDIAFLYGSVPRGIFTLYKASLGGYDWTVALEPLADVGEIYVALFLLMITFMYLAVINVISALFLQGAIEAGYSDREDVIEAQLSRKKEYVRKAVGLFHELDDDADGQLSLTEFSNHLHDSRIIGFFNSLDIDIKDAWSLFVLLDVDQGGSVSMDDFVDGLLNLKGEAKSVHIAQILMENKWQMDAIYELVNFMDSEFELVHRELSTLKSIGQQKAKTNIVREPVQQHLANSNPSGQQVIMTV